MAAQYLATSRQQVESPVAAATPDAPPWLTTYLSRLRRTDIVSVAVAAAVAELVRMGAGPDLTSLVFWVRLLVPTLLVLVWLGALQAFACRDPRVVGNGAEEGRRIAHASAALFGTIAVAAYLLRVELARGYLVVALPTGVFLLLLSRWYWRRRLVRARREGRCITRILVVGSEEAAASMADTFEQSKGAGYSVVGVCVPGGQHGGGDHVRLRRHNVPVHGDQSAVLQALASTGAEVVAVSNAEALGDQGLRALAWQLESVDVDLVVSAGLIDVAGPRLQIRPMAGLPLLHIDKPQYRRAANFGKTSFDVVTSAVGLVLLSPVLLALALAVKLDSPGAVFYRADRVGLNGQPFRMLKFRSMVSDADDRRRHLAAVNEGSGPLFKLRNDPRVTRVGRWMRRFSVDELPQLLNVLRGHMSLVGPRPPLHAEVAAYTGDVHRRLLVKPGITGLWQVSGRSNLSWEESVRLDLFYVENWSMIQDLLILWRTVGAVCTSRGAY